jgi:hypothetical protein
VTNKDVEDDSKIEGPKQLEGFLAGLDFSK